MNIEPLSTEVIAKLSNQAEHSDFHKLLKFAIDQNVEVNEICKWAKIPNDEFYSWVEGKTPNSFIQNIIKDRLIELGFIKNIAVKGNRFSIKEIRSKLALEKAVESHHIADHKKRLKEKRENDQKITLEKKLEQNEFISKYGRKLLESALSGETQLFLYGQRNNRMLNQFKLRGLQLRNDQLFNINEIDEETCDEFNISVKTSSEKLSALSDLGSNNLKKLLLENISKTKKILNSFPDNLRTDNFYRSLHQLIGQNGYYMDESVEDLLKLAFLITSPGIIPSNESLKNLVDHLDNFNNIVDEFKDDDLYIPRWNVSWDYPNEHSNEISDCTNAKFLDWVSDLHGNKLINEIFTAIELLDLNGEKQIKLEIKKEKARNEYTDFYTKTLIKIKDVDIPFPISTLVSMFSILNYKVRFTKTSSKDFDIYGDLFLEW